MNEALSDVLANYIWCLALSPSTDIDNDGVIEADTDAPQEMGDFENLEVLCWHGYIYFA